MSPCSQGKKADPDSAKTDCGVIVPVLRSTSAIPAFLLIAGGLSSFARGTYSVKPVLTTFGIAGIGDKFIIFDKAATFVAKSISITEKVYDALLGLKRGNMTFSDVILEMYDELYGTVDESEAS